MRWSQWLLLLCLCLCLVGNRGQATALKDMAVQVSALVQTNPPKITLQWPVDSLATNYTVYRKTRDATNWGAGWVLGTNVSRYEDTNVSVGCAWEYRVQKGGWAGSVPIPYEADGYVYAGIETPLTENRGKLILLVDQTVTNALSEELIRLKWDLIGDGWQVLRHDVLPTDSVTNIKAIIQAEYNTDTNQVKAVFLLGHVPVPYSGDMAPDGHPDHTGAWPADVFYGDMHGVWTDAITGTNQSAYLRIRNLPGDGKYDQDYLPASVELQVGRVDLYQMPAFSLSTVELLRQYLRKDHHFKHRDFTAERRAFIDDQFGLVWWSSTNYEAFAANAWRDFSTFFGPSNCAPGSWFGLHAGQTTLTNQSFLWAYGGSGGYYTGAYEIGSTSDFATKDSQAVFTMLFGSEFGDWDSANCFLRAPLAAKSFGLTCVWAGRPWWEFHHMALGETIGFSTRVSQENPYLYDANGDAVRLVSVALMGDPSLRMHPVAPPGPLLVASNATGGLDLSWRPSPDTVAGYHVYRAVSNGGAFLRLTTAPISGTNFTDSLATTNLYMVRAIKLETSASGTYWNASQGVFQNAARTFGLPPISAMAGMTNGFQIAWPAVWPAILQQCSSLTTPGWTAATNAITATNGNNRVILPPNGPLQFYRLAEP
ncbi:MAG: hypothetical protein WCO56_09010 [Verrucomicrobiota bacterium]